MTDLRNVDSAEAQRRAEETAARLRAQQAEQAQQALQAQQTQQQQTTPAPTTPEIGKDTFVNDPKVAEELGLSKEQLGQAFDQAAQLDGNDTLSHDELSQLFVSLCKDDKPLPKPTADKPQEPVTKAPLDPTSQGIQDAASTLGKALVQQNTQEGELIGAATKYVGDAVITQGKQDGANANALIDEGGKQAGSLIAGAGDLLGSALNAVGATSAAASVHDASTALGNDVAAVADSVGDAAQWSVEMNSYVQGTVVSVGGEAVKGTLKSAAELADVALEVGAISVTEGPLAAADKMADKTMGPEVPAYKGQIDGFTGVITNRLDRGESVMIKSDTSVEIGAVGPYAAAKATGAATLGRDSEGNITLRLEVAGEGEGGVKGTVGLSGQIGSEKFGATADLKAGGVIQEGAAVNLKFNPNNPADVARLKSLIEPKSNTSDLLSASLNPAAVSLNPAAIKDVMANNYDSCDRTEAVGVRVGASTEGDLGPVKAQLGVTAEGFLGDKVKYNKDGTKETTIFMRGQTEGTAGVTEQTTGVGIGAKGSGDAAMSFIVKQDKDGKILEMSGATSVQLGGSVGVTVGKGDVDKEGKEGKVGPEAGGSVTQTDTVKLTPAAVDLANARIKAGEAPLLVYRSLMQDPANVTRQRMQTTSNQFSYGLEFKVAAEIGQVTIGSKITVGKTKDVNLDPNDLATPVHRVISSDVYS